ncbi:hypothetical protein K7X08_027774 [Anisodus acutangulus]|uniref:Uncharacterized protein n=1 Tax=Anisodus acutangulus TaxID=402998 RepID=A0A9Q1R2Z6_9SOLA|nr:hypothetical protein K7X08_027774 [Anisodus acutangulus]
MQNVAEEDLDGVMPMVGPWNEVTRVKNPKDVQGQTLTVAQRHEFGLVDERFPPNNLAQLLCKIGPGFEEPLDDDLPIPEPKPHDEEASDQEVDVAGEESEFDDDNSDTDQAPIGSEDEDADDADYEAVDNEEQTMSYSAPSLALYLLHLNSALF